MRAALTLTARSRLFALRFARARVVWLAPILALLEASGAGAPANAHGFGQRYELPLPLDLYLFGAATVVALSFVLFGLLLRGLTPAQAGPRRDLLVGRVGGMLAHPLVMLALRLVMLALFVLTLLAGFLGDQNP